ncbi:conserved hypothetical protein [Burkholderiales bacterium 8X]|nr:conserved hypothetical protein [Burkholderiales bacterium 8X]
MSDDYQVDIPPSFFAVYTNARGRLTEPLAEVRARYDVCEDLANILVQQALLLHHAELPSESGILQKIHAGLSAAESGVTPAEAAWIVERLAELLNWRCPVLEANPPAGDDAAGTPSGG